MSLLFWQAVVATCLANFVYSATAKVITETRDGSQDLSFDEDNFISCPTTDNLREPVYFPHPIDCQSFYVCDSGFARLQQCQPGLHFNPSLKACDYPAEAGCEKAVSLKPRVGIIEDDSEECPNKNSKFPILLPDVTDCTKFYICDNGSPHRQTCQSGLHFNPKLNACDYPEKAGCDKGVTEKPKGRMIEEDEDSDVCPSSNPKHPVLIPHPEDCNKFYICDNGSPHLQTCQSGLHFNPKLKSCDFPNNVGCDEDTDTSNKLREKSLDEDDLVSCSAIRKSGGQPLLLPHPTECGKFFICDNGKPHLQSCQPGLHFNPKLQACDYPENTDCREQMTSALSGVPSPFCPPVNGKSPVFYRHPSNCSVYYMCSHGSAYEFACPARLHFNLRKKQCDYETEARCLEYN